MPATEALSDEPLPRAAEEASLPEPADTPPEPRRPAVEAPAESSTESPAESPTEELPRPARAAPRAGAADFGADEVDAESDESHEPVEPPEPVVSANATGTDATAAPTPKATANAPTRPTNCA